jgi:O-acetyl-ADP-ribose deacetylase (regulator of RNase III)
MTRLSVVVGDITQLDAEAIVNAANEQLMRGGGVCGAIFRAAGPRLAAACAAASPWERSERGANAKLSQSGLCFVASARRMPQFTERV